MGRLLAGNAPLRGANLEMVVRPFDHWLAADYWRITDPALAVRTHAVVGGTPAYRPLVNEDRPHDLADFDDWVLRTVLNPGSPLFLEARYLLAEETTELREVGIYHSVLAAVAAGTTPAEASPRTSAGRRATSPINLNVWEDTGLLVREEDAFRRGRSRYRVVEPLVMFYAVVSRPQWGRLEAGRARSVWVDARPRFQSQVLCPQFEQLCRRWAELAEPPIFGEAPGAVGAGVVADPANRTQIQLDVVVFAPAGPGRPKRILSLGEATWGQVMSGTDLHRLRRAGGLLADRGFDTASARYTCYSGAGFDEHLRAAAAQDPRAQLIGLTDLYARPSELSFPGRSRDRRVRRSSMPGTTPPETPEPTRSGAVVGRRPGFAHTRRGRRLLLIGLFAWALWLSLRGVDVRYPSGQALATRFYRQEVAPRLNGVPHAAALLGDGSEVLGYDDEVSTDHDFGPRVQLFLPGGADLAPVHAVLAGLPERFEEHPVVFPATYRYGGRPHHQVEVTTAEDYFTAALGTDPAGGMALADWLLAPTQRLATLTAGVVMHDPDQVLARRRAALAWYPDDVWRYVLAAQWLRVGQEEPFVGRTGSTGDDLGSAVVAARLVRDLMRLAFLVERRWAPYSKWLGRAFADLPLAGEVGPRLRGALAADDWREREAAVCAAASVLGDATNRLGLAEPVDPAPRRFHRRDLRVVGAERFTEALTAAVTDREVVGLLARLGTRGGDATVGALPGAIDQAVDSVDILSHPTRCRAAAPLLGLGVARR